MIQVELICVHAHLLCGNPYLKYKPNAFSKFYDFNKVPLKEQHLPLRIDLVTSSVSCNKNGRKHTKIKDKPNHTSRKSMTHVQIRAQIVHQENSTGKCIGSYTVATYI